MIHVIHYLLRDSSKDDEAVALFSLTPLHNDPFIWFGIETVTDLHGISPSVFKLLGCDSPPTASKAGMHYNHGNFIELSRRYPIQSFSWAERISEAEFETYHEIANLPILDLRMTR